MDSNSKRSLKNIFQHVFDVCDAPTLKQLRAVYNQRAQDAALPEVEREIAQIQVEAVDPFIRYLEAPNHLKGTKIKHPFQG